MLTRIQDIFHSLIFRLISLVGLVLLVSIIIWAYYNIDYQKHKTFQGTVEEVDRLGNTIKLGTHYAMMLNSREDINEIIKNIGRQEGIQNVRIFNKQGQIKFSNVPREVNLVTNIKADACYICHDVEPPREDLDIGTRTRIFDSESGYRLLGIISPIYNEPSCSSDSCHVHPQGKKVLGALDVVVSLKNKDSAILAYERWIIALAIFTFMTTSTIIGIFLFTFVNRPIKRLISWTALIAQGGYEPRIYADWDDEMGRLAMAINQMGRQIGEKQEELNRQRHEYQELFEQVPCYITVQDSNFRLLRYNREFSDEFAPSPGGYCYSIYKGRSEKCDPCPVTMTFQDGKSHTIEETGTKKDGAISYWIGRTSPIRDFRGEITAVMEMSVDVTEMKHLQEEIRKSEEKYRHIFNNIPNPVFVLNSSNLMILDCNDSVMGVYGFTKEELVKTSFLKLFEEAEHQDYGLEIRTSETMNNSRQITKDGKVIYVHIRISPCEYLGRKALLVTTSDITKRLLAEQQLIQAGKMATLGEMATGMAHELNQPLSVIKTASVFLRKKVKKKEPIREDILQTMAEEIDSHVDRASKIINHLREFGRKSEVKKERVQINDAMEKALEIFSQQLKLREIEVVREMEPNLPLVLANANRLEQVFINLLINARDAIEEKCEKTADKSLDKKIFLRSSLRRGKVTAEVQDTGPGIPKYVREKIFEPFFTTKRVGKGTGLGLSISYGIVQDYEGTIQVETSEGQGTNFIIQLPTAGDAP